MAERKHMHIVEMGLDLLAQSGLSSSFWDDAFTTSTFIINRIPSQTIRFSTPYEKLFHKKPDYHLLKAFGCLCYPHIRPLNHNKLQFRSTTATFIGYNPSHKGYKALIPSGKVIISRDVVFDETTFPHLTSDTVSSPSFTSFSPSMPPTDSQAPLIPSSTSPPINSSTSSPPHIFVSSTPVDASSPAPSPDSSQSSSSYHTSSPSPSPIVPSQLSADPSPSPQPHAPTPIPSDNTTPRHSMITRSRHGIFKPKIYTTQFVDPSLTIPRPFLIALLIPVWKATMIDEFLALLQNKTWTLTFFPPGKNLIGCVWIFRLKKDDGG